MAAEDGKIHYSDLIAPDNSFEKIIAELSAINQSYSDLVKAVQLNAKTIVKAIKDMSTATSSGRAQLDEAAMAADRLERAEKELAFSLSETGKQVAWLKAQTADNNRQTVEQQRQTNALAGSYDKLKLQLKEQIALYKSLSESERTASFGENLLNDILSTKNQLSELDDQLKLHVLQLSKVEKAQQQLDFYLSEEGQRYLDLKKQINDIVRGNNAREQSVDQLALAQEKLNKAQSEANVKLQELNIKTKEANTIAKLQAQLNTSTAGSYNALSAQYELNKIKLNNMSASDENAAEEMKKLQTECKELYAEMIKLQEATGNHRLSVGDYSRAWNGLQNSVTQVIRELPAAAVGLNTFMLGISNNIPIVIDEIKRVREQNRLLAAEGKPTVSVTKEIIRSIFNWQTALIVLITIMSAHGKEIVEWVRKLFMGPKPAMEIAEQIKAISDELEKNSKEYGKNLVAYKKLQREWKNLETLKEQKQWIKDNQSEFAKLDVSVRDVNEAENVFVNQTDAMISALMARAKAAAAEKLAQDKYGQAMSKKIQAERSRYGLMTDEQIANLPEGEREIAKKAKADFEKNARETYQKNMAASGPHAAAAAGSTSTSEIVNRLRNEVSQRVKDLQAEAKALEQDGDSYFYLAKAERDYADSILERAKIEGYHKRDRGGNGHGRQLRDLTDIIHRNDINIQRQHEKSITNLQKDEFAKRREESANHVADENRKLEELYRKNVEYVNNTKGEYEALTEDQKKMIEQQQKWIKSTIANNLRSLALELQQIQKEQAANSLKINREVVKDLDFSAYDKDTDGKEPPLKYDVYDVTTDREGLEDSLREERNLMLEHLRLEYNAVAAANQKMLEEGDENARDQEEILTEYNKKAVEIYDKYDQLIFGMRKADTEAQIELVRHGTEEELELLYQQNEIARQSAIAANAAKPAHEQIDTETINRLYDKRALGIKGDFGMTNFDEAQKQAEAEFNIARHNANEIKIFKLKAERDRWKKQIELAKDGALDWSDAQIAAAEATVEGLERQIKEAGDFINIIGEKNIGGALLTLFGFDDKQIAAWEDFISIILENLKMIIQAEIDVAQAAVEAAEKRVEAAQNAYDQEVEARNNGYANNVATAKKELQLEKKNQMEKQKLLEEAQKRMEAINTAIQASSLITASANIWAAFSPIPMVGPALALAAISAMWTSFAVAKIKAAQITAAASQEYGEGGLEFLDGGSHASGNDIDLHTKNSKGRNMRAEGGEAMAIINKRNTRKYRKELPDIIKSLNRGNFEEKYLKAFEHGDILQAQINANSTVVDLKQLEKDVQAIKKQNETKVYALGDGRTMIIHNNVKRIIR